MVYSMLGEWCVRADLYIKLPCPLPKLCTSHQWIKPVGSTTAPVSSGQPLPGTVRCRQKTYCTPGFYQQESISDASRTVIKTRPHVHILIPMFCKAYGVTLSVHS